MAAKQTTVICQVIYKCHWCNLDKYLDTRGSISSEERFEFSRQTSLSCWGREWWTCLWTTCCYRLNQTTACFLAYDSEHISNMQMNFKLQWQVYSLHPLINSMISTMISLTHHNNVWHLESLYGVSWLQLTSKVNVGNPGSRLRWSMPIWWTTPQSGNLVSPPTTTVVSPEPFPYRSRALRGL